MTSTVQEYITVCIPFSSGSEWTDLRVQEIEALIGRLCNPIKADLADRLTDLGVVHFLSLNVLPRASKSDRAYIIFEATVDGDAEEALQHIGEALSDDLFPILSRACGLATPQATPQFLRKHHYTMRQNNFFSRRTSITGMPFNGKAGLSVSSIKRNQLIAETIREKMDDQDKKRAIATKAMIAEGEETHDEKGPLSQFTELKNFAQQHIDIVPSLKANNGKFDSKIAENVAFADRKDAPWLMDQNIDDDLNISNIIGLISREVRAVLIVCFTITFLTIGYGLNSALAFLPISTIRNWLSNKEPVLQDFQERFFEVSPDNSTGPILAEIGSQIFITFNTAALAGASSLVLVLAGAYIAYKRLRWSETGKIDTKESIENPKRNYPKDLDPDPKIVTEIMARENAPNSVQNHMYHVVPMISGAFRRTLLRLAFRVIGRGLSGGLVRPGFLSGVGTAHTVRWFIPPGSKRLVFSGHYDGNWESYLEDFITKSPRGTTAIWSNCQGFPRTRNLFQDGAVDGDRLKRYARRNMLPSRCWYSAYSDITAEQIRKHALIYDGLCQIRESDASSAQAWLNLFDSVPRPAAMLEHEKIQSLLYGNQSHLNNAVCIIANFRDASPDRIRSFLTEHVIENITFGDRKPEKEAFYIAFSSSGLRKLGLEELLAPNRKANNAGAASGGLEPSEFAPAFAMGMDHEVRQRLLNDRYPADWLWGHGAAEADVALLLYWDSEGGQYHGQNVDMMCQSWQEKFALFGFDLVHHIDISHHADPKLKATEPFGFADGISQPIVRGLSKEHKDGGSIHDVEPGEFVLGYKDNRGYYPPTPHIQTENTNSGSNAGYLPAVPSDMPLRYPAFDTQSNLKDFGRNGSYLVIRQLEQKVDQFEDFCAQASRTLAQASGKVVTPELAGALMVGRWKNGNAIVHHPDEPTAIPLEGIENEFLYGEIDPQGFRCPLGAHVRRSNPRDSLDPGRSEELSVSNRHRVLRRGRTYWAGNAAKGERTGLLFMCLNADIERQFEFVQSTWINSSSFHGLEGEQDPLLSQHTIAERRRKAGRDAPKYSIPSNAGNTSLSGITEFVTLMGGGYFFLPGKQSLKFVASSAGKSANRMPTDAR